MTVHIAIVEDEAAPRDTLLAYLKRFEGENDVTFSVCSKTISRNTISSLWISRCRT